MEILTLPLVCAAITVYAYVILLIYRASAETEKLEHYSGDIESDADSVKEK
jgi:hypothetical protein